MAGYEVSGSAFDKIYGQLKAGHEDMESIATSMPTSSDAGLLTAPLAAMLADCLRNGAQFSTGMIRAADEVVASKESYQEVDAVGQQDIESAGGR